MSYNFAARFLLAALTVVLISGCGEMKGPILASNGDDDSGPSDSLVAGGSSFAYPVMNHWTSYYNKETGVQVNYQSLGSSGGIKQFTVKTLDFGATDAPMTEEQLAEAKDDVLHIPVVMGAVAVTYNLPGVKSRLTLSGEVVANIYLGKIKKWNDPAIAALNPSVPLPAADIVTVRRADGSGTTFIFADFLAKSSPEWEKIVGVGNSLDWPADSIGGKGNEGVAARVQQTKNSIGYVELVYALQSKLSTAAIINQAGSAVIPSIATVTAAAAELTTIPEDLRLSITNAPGEKAYPMAGITWIVARTKMDNTSKALAVQAFLTYILSDKSQATADKLNYSKLPPKLLELARSKINKISGIN